MRIKPSIARAIPERLVKDSAVWCPLQCTNCHAELGFVSVLLSDVQLVQRRLIPLCLKCSRSFVESQSH